MKRYITPDIEAVVFENKSGYLLTGSNEGFDIGDDLPYE